MGAVILTSAVKPHRDRNLGLERGENFTNEPRIEVLWDGVANRKQNNTLADGVVWVDLSQLMRTGIIQGILAFQSRNSGAATIAIAASFSPGRLANMLTNDAAGNALVTAENPNFAVVSATLANGAIATVQIPYTLAKITFAVGTPQSLLITAV